MKTKLHIVLIFTLSLVWLMVLQAVCLGATYYLDANATGNKDGTTWEHAWTNIIDAFRTATYGDTVLIRDGNYGKITNPITFPAYTGSMTDPLPTDTQFITFKADAGHEPVFTGISITSSSPIYVPYIFDGFTINSAGHGVSFHYGIVGPRFKNCKITGPGYNVGDYRGFNILSYQGNLNNDIRIENCEIAHYQRGFCTQCNNLVIKDCDINNFGSLGMSLWGGANILIEGNHFHDQQRVEAMHADVIAFMHGNIIIRGNKIHGQQGQAIFGQGYGVKDNVLIENNLIYDCKINEISGWYYDGGAGGTPEEGPYIGENWVIRYNTIVAYPKDWSTCTSGVYANFINSDVYNNIFLTRDYGGRGLVNHGYNIVLSLPSGEENSYTYGRTEQGRDTALAELFVDPDNGDYHLKPGVRAINFGSTKWYGSQGWPDPATDLEGNPRINDGTPDAGCYEYISTGLQPPIANAGPDQTVIDEDKDGSEKVTLDGSGSMDPDGTIISYVWTEDGTQIATGVNPTVTLSTGVHTIMLTVTDDGGLTNTDTVTISIVALANQPPIANAGADQTVTDTDGNGSEEVTLDGSGSFDPDGIIISYVWSEGGLQIATGINPTVTLSIGTHSITLTVTDNGGLTDTDTVTIEVLKGDKEFGELPTGCYNNVINPLKGEKALIVVDLQKQAHLKLNVYDTRGNRIRELADEEKEADTHWYYWDGRNDSGSVVGSGLYFVHIQAGDYKKTKKIVVVK